MRVPLATAAAIGGVKPATVLKWVQRGHIGRYPDDGMGEFETSEILLWLDQTRDVGKVISAMHQQHQTDKGPAVQHPQLGRHGN